MGRFWSRWPRPMPDQIRIIEVAPRDGLQNEIEVVPTPVKAEFIRSLAAAGLREIEATSFVHPKWVPQLADAADLLTGLGPIPGVRISTLVPNEKGLERAVGLGVQAIAVFTAASEAFVQKNINMTVDESLAVFDRVIQSYRGQIPNGFVRGYLSTVVECPFSGRVSPGRVAELVEKLFELGCDEVSLGETIGVAIPAEVVGVAREVEKVTSQSKIAWHFHDTRGTAIANVSAMLDRGYRSFDSSAAGLGGCPYAPGAGGNLATEDLVYFAERSGLATGVDLEALARCSAPVLQVLGRPATAKSQLAVLAACKSL
ncbi:MAG: hydroxymethylglutaryl-CoA lyase [Armatimonadetes bacterium]|nr:hydroxymethylglutaryl-CoA lyase [Armatimonadota bacterium]